jgi:hypothetical protein
MFTITEYSVELVKDPFGILSGKRYEFTLDLQVDEEDELYSEQGIFLRVVYRVEEESAGIVKYEFLERNTNKYLDFELEEEEAEAVRSFCQAHFSEAEE